METVLLATQLEHVEKKIDDLHSMLGSHMSKTEKTHEKLLSLSQELGTQDDIRERRIFIESLINRERDRAKLRRAIIEKGLLVALIAIAAFIAHAVWNEGIAIIHEGMAGIRKP